jgi:hypothetical protein
MSEHREPPLWDPSTRIDDAVCRAIGLDPTTASRTIGGVAPPAGFALWSAHDVTGMYSVTVWSQIYTLDDFLRKEASAEFVPVTIADRAGYRYSPAGDTTGDHCTLIFPAAQGSCSIQLIRQSARAPSRPCDKAIEIATVLVPLFPK